MSQQQKLPAFSSESGEELRDAMVALSKKMAAMYAKNYNADKTTTLEDWEKMYEDAVNLQPLVKSYFPTWSTIVNWALTAETDPKWVSIISASFFSSAVTSKLNANRLRPSDREALRLALQELLPSSPKKFDVPTIKTAFYNPVGKIANTIESVVKSLLIQLPTFDMDEFNEVYDQLNAKVLDDVLSIGLRVLRDMLVKSQPDLDWAGAFALDAEGNFQFMSDVPKEEE